MRLSSFLAAESRSLSSPSKNPLPPVIHFTDQNVTGQENGSHRNDDNTYQSEAPVQRRRSRISRLTFSPTCLPSSPARRDSGAHHRVSISTDGGSSSTRYRPRPHSERGPTLRSSGLSSALSGPVKILSGFSSELRSQPHSSSKSKCRYCDLSICFRRLIKTAHARQGPEGHLREEALKRLFWFPLRFKNVELEREFRLRMVDSYPCRLATTAIAWLITCLVLWVGITTAVIVAPPSPAVNTNAVGLVVFHTTEKVVLHIFFSLLCIINVGLILAPILSVCRPRLELMLFIFLTMSETISVSWNGFVFLTAARTLNKINANENASAYDEFYNYRLWTGMLLVLIRVTELLFCTVAVPTRTQITFYFVAYTLVNHALFFVLSNFVIYAELAHPQAGLLFFLTVFVVGMLGFLGRYMSELYDRIYLYHPMERYRAVQRLLRKSKRHTTTTTQKLTVLELILENLQRAKDCITHDQNVIDAPTAVSLIDQSIAMLAQTNKFIFPGAAFPVGLAAVKEFVLGRPPEDSQGRHSGPLWTDSFRYSVQGGATQFTDAVLGPGPSSAHRASVTALFLAPGELERKTSGIPALETKKNRHFTDFLLRSPRSRRLAVIPPTAPPARTPGATDSSTASPSSRSFEEPLQILSGTPSLASPRRASIQECGPTDIELKAVAMLLPEPLPPSITLHLDPMLVESLGTVGKEWELDIMTLFQRLPIPMIPIGKILLHSVITSCMSGANVETFLSHMSNLYQSNPYHNSMHACMVAHSAMCLSRCLGLWNYWGVIEVAALMIGALGHDVAHRGRNNSFYSNTVDPLVVIYNEQSPLENFHACLTMQLVQQEGTNIFGSFREKFITRTFRRSVVEFILVTDMKQHFDTISRLRVRKAAPDFDFYNCLDDFLLVGKLCMKAGDLSHTAVEWSRHMQWSLRVCEEFYQQGDEERRLGLPLSPLCDRTLHKELPKAQKGFIDFVALPLFQELQVLMDSSCAGGSFSSVEESLCDHCCQQMQLNAAGWEELNAEADIVIPEEYTKMKTNQSPVFDSFYDAFEACIYDTTHRRKKALMVSADPLSKRDNGILDRYGSPFVSESLRAAHPNLASLTESCSNQLPSLTASPPTEEHLLGTSKEKLNKRTPLGTIAAAAAAPFTRLTRPPT